MGHERATSGGFGRRLPNEPTADGLPCLKIAETNPLNVGICWLFPKKEGHYRHYVDSGRLHATYSCATNRNAEPSFWMFPHDGVAKCVPNTMVPLSAYFSQNARRVFFAIAPSASNASSHSGYAHCTG